MRYKTLQAYIKGYMSAIYRDGTEVNPYQKNTGLAAAWERGHVSGRRAFTLFTKDLHRSAFRQE
jgi:hypothetical protein